MGLWIWRYREPRQKAGIRGGPHDVVRSPIHSPNRRVGTLIDNTEFNDVAARGIAAITHVSAEDNTDRAYRSKIFEYFEFSDYFQSVLRSWVAAVETPEPVKLAAELQSGSTTQPGVRDAPHPPGWLGPAGMPPCCAWGR